MSEILGSIGHCLYSQSGIPSSLGQIAAEQSALAEPVGYRCRLFNQGPVGFTMPSVSSHWHQPKVYVPSLAHPFTIKRSRAGNLLLTWWSAETPGKVLPDISAGGRIYTSGPGGDKPRCPSPPVVSPPVRTVQQPDLSPKERTRRTSNQRDHLLTIKMSSLETKLLEEIDRNLNRK